MNHQPPTLFSANNVALRAAAVRGDVNAVQTLLATTDIDINATDGYGRTALILATYQGSITIVEALLARADLAINIKDGCGRTTLILAAYMGCAIIVSALLTKTDIDVNATDVFGRSALIWAACNDHIGVIYQLLATPGIRVNLTDRANMTALMHARNRHNPAMIAALEQAVLRDALMEAYRLNFDLNGAQIWAATMPEILALQDQWLPDQDAMLFLMGFMTPLTYQEARTLLPFLQTAYAVHVILSQGAPLEQALALITAVEVFQMPCNTAPPSLATTVQPSAQRMPMYPYPLFSHRSTE